MQLFQEILHWFQKEEITVSLYPSAEVRHIIFHKAQQPATRDSYVVRYWATATKNDRTAKKIQEVAQNAYVDGQSLLYNVPRKNISLD